MENQIQEQKNNEIKNRKIFDKTLIFLFVVFLVVSSFFIGKSIGVEEGSERERFPIENTVIVNEEGAEVRSLDFSLFWEIWDLLKEKYVDTESLDAQELFYGAIKGMLQATGDPYTSFLTPEENKMFSSDIAGSFEGIGAEVGMRDGLLTIIAPLEGSPAEEAGLRAGDKVIEIDGESTLEMSLDESVKRMRGPEDTEVILTVLREESEEAQDIKIIRDVIEIDSVRYEAKDNNISYIRISNFGERTEEEFAVALNKTVKQLPKAIILDLRGNPGGLLDDSIKIASKMLPKGKVVVIQEDQDKNQSSSKARGGDQLSHIKTMVLIDEGSASASEIVAGALKDNRENVTILGEQSFGKGSVQEFVNLSGGSAVKITTARWLRPNGEQINDVGITPDIEVERTLDDFENDRDPQLDKALEILNQ